MVILEVNVKQENDNFMGSASIHTHDAHKIIDAAYSAVHVLHDMLDSIVLNPEMVLKEMVNQIHKESINGGNAS